MQATVVREGSSATIRLTGRFDFNTHREFRSVYESLVTDVSLRIVTVDFDGVDYLDSSALGMLLMLRDKMTGGGKEVLLANLKGAVKQVIEIANFGKLFKIA